MPEKAIKKGAYIVGVIVLSFAIYNITHFILARLGVDQRLGETVGRLLASIVIATVFRKVCAAGRFSLKSKNFWKGMSASWFILGVSVLTFTLSSLEAQEYPFVIPSAYLLLLVVAEQLLIGIFEEFLFRGVILNMLLEKGQENPTNKVSAILISSVLFGLVHLLNLFDHPDLILFTVSQVFYATFIGIYLAVLYLKTRNIWVVALCHAAIDLAGALPQILYVYPETAVSDISMGDFWLNMLNFLFVVAALFLSRTPKAARCR